MGIGLLLCLLLVTLDGADELRGSEKSAAVRGYRFLIEKEYLSRDFDQETFDEVWKTWPEPLRSQAEKASLKERRRMAFQRYGLTTRPGDDSGKPLQYVVDKKGNWTMNCLACHSGKVAGKVVLGLPNSHYALLTLTEEIRATKLRLNKRMTRMDIGSMFMPLGTTNGTTNAVNFGVALLAYRDAELNVHRDRKPPKMLHHDLEAPPWWHFKKHKRLYLDGFVEKGPRPLMQFMLSRSNGPEKFRQWEADFRDVYAFLESLEAPKYPHAVNRKLAAEGQKVFQRTCAECHGTYGEKETYPERLVPIDEIGTDRARLDSITIEHRRAYEKTWFAHYGKKKVIADPGGYIAPPLDGIWASAPYLHNGSVPTLWHMLHPKERPTVWQRTRDGYDRDRMGLEVQIFDKVPGSVKSFAEIRTYFDTQRFGKSAAGHTFPDRLTEPEKRAVLEYLKTL